MPESALILAFPCIGFHHTCFALLHSAGSDSAMDFTRHNYKDWKHGVYKQVVLEKECLHSVVCHRPGG